MIVLDTSAILAHFFEEPGQEIVAGILEKRDAWIAAPTWLELQVKLFRLPERSPVVEKYRSLVAGTININQEVADAAFELRSATPGRLPVMDALIAGAARVRGFRLLHRDAHMSLIPQALLSHSSLSPKA